MKKSKRPDIEVSPTSKTIDIRDAGIPESRFFNAESEKRTNPDIIRSVSHAVDLVIQFLNEVMMQGDHEDNDFVTSLSLREAKFKKLKQVAAKHGTNSVIFIQELKMCMTSIDTMLLEFGSKRQTLHYLKNAKRLLDNIS